MLLLGQQRQRTCQGLTRRAFLEAGACSVFGLSLPDRLRGRAAGLDARRLAGLPRTDTGGFAAVARGRGAGARRTRLARYMVIGGRLDQGKKPTVGEGGGTLGGQYGRSSLEFDPVGGTRIPAM